MIFVKLTELSLDARRYHLLRAFQVADGQPITYTQVKCRAEAGVMAHNPDEVEKGLLNLNPVFQTAIHMGEIKAVQGGYVLTERGSAQLSQVIERLEQKFDA